VNEDLVPAPTDPLSSYRAIENLIAAYAELVDDGDFAGLGRLLADATFAGSGAPVSGPHAIEQMFRDMLIVYDDGTPRTKQWRFAERRVRIDLTGDLSRHLRRPQ
jgi:ketosteroid isomerase-like protein